LAVPFSPLAIRLLPLLETALLTAKSSNNFLPPLSYVQPTTFPLLRGDGANGPSKNCYLLMADTITIPSPRVFLTASPIIEPHDPPPKPAPSKPKQARKRNPTSTKARTVSEKTGDTTIATGNGVEKKKQSKSRNGT
jgi:hypothetical protein